MATAPLILGRSDPPPLPSHQQSMGGLRCQPFTGPVLQHRDGGERCLGPHQANQKKVLAARQDEEMHGFVGAAYEHR
jgi:hypothetical protein